MKTIDAIVRFAVSIFMCYNKEGTELFSHGGVAQLGARLNGIQKVVGSIPIVSTTDFINLI